MDGAALMTRARAGEGGAFAELTDPYRRELQLHCYRLLGSWSDAEDALQDTLLAAWQGLDRFEGRSSVRTWLYRIATNTCLDARRSARRRPARAWDVHGVHPPDPTRLGDVVWLEPYPDPLASQDVTAPGPEARYERTEAVSLAFVTALQVLPPRQVAVLVLRDVLGFRAAEVAEILGSSVESVTSALKRARAGLRRRWTPDHERPDPPPVPGSAAEGRVVAAFVRAWESADITALVSLLSEDVTISMPPMPFEYEGRERVVAFCQSLFAAGRRFDLVPTTANGQPALGVYVRTDHGRSHAAGLYVLGLAGEHISSMVRFEGTVLPWFGLPRSVPARGQAPSWTS